MTVEFNPITIFGIVLELLGLYRLAHDLLGSRNLDAWTGRVEASRLRFMQTFWTDIRTLSGYLKSLAGALLLQTEAEEAIARNAEFRAATAKTLRNIEEGASDIWNKDWKKFEEATAAADDKAGMASNKQSELTRIARTGLILVATGTGVQLIGNIVNFSLRLYP